MISIAPSLPGIGTSYTATPSEFLQNDIGLEQLEGGRILDGTVSGDPNSTTPQFIANGTILGKITATGKYAPAIIGVTAGAVTTGSTSVSVSAAQAAELVRRVGATGNLTMVGPPTVGGTTTSEVIAYSAVNTSTGAITIANPAAAHVAGSIIVAGDGSGVPVAFLRTNGYPLTTLDPMSGNRQDVQIPRLVVAGHIITANVPGYSLLSADAKAYVKTTLNSKGRHYIFDDDF